MEKSEREAIQGAVNLAAFHEALTRALIELSWFADGVTTTEAEVISSLGDIAHNDEGVAQTVIGMSWLEDGVVEIEAEATEELIFITDDNVEIAEMVLGLPWFADGVDRVEVDTVREVGFLTQEDVDLAMRVTGLDWVTDEVNGIELEAIRSLAFITNYSADVGRLFGDVPWFTDGIDRTEADAVYELSLVTQGDVGVAMKVVGLDWFSDEINEVELETVRSLAFIANDSAEVAGVVTHIPWLADGVNRVESDALREFSFVTQEDADAAKLVLDLEWFVDDVTRTEVEIVREVSFISSKDGPAAQRILAMPFLATIESPDVRALASLSGMVDERPESFDYVMSHPSLADGITDEMSPVVAMLNGVADTNPGLTDTLLDPESISIERRAITLPLSGGVELTIVRTRSGSPTSMDLLEHSVRMAEDLMAEPLPTGYVGLLYEDAVLGSSFGTNFGTHIAVRSERAAEADYVEGSSDTGSIAHEVAHYYWSGNADWVDEGAADFFNAVIEKGLDGEEVMPEGGPCPYMRTISELDEQPPDSDTDEFGCNYTLGERLFLDLYRSINEVDFWQGIRDLYVRSQVSEEPDNPYGSTRIDIEHIREVFKSDAAAVVTARWYDGTEPFDLSLIDTDPADPELPTINGVIDRVKVSMGDDDSAVMSFSSQDVTDPVWFTLGYSYSVSGGPRHVSLDTMGIYEDGFEFHRGTIKVTAESMYIGGAGSVFLGAGRWAPGRYWVYVYDGDRKVSEVQFEVIP